MNYKRILSVFVCLSLIVCLFLFPMSASAADLSWKDLVKDVNIDSGTVTIQFPATPTTFDIYEFGEEASDTISRFNNVASFSYNFRSWESSGIEYAIQITPGSDSFLLLTNIPDNTELNVWLEITSVDLPVESIAKPAWDFSVGRYNAHMYLFNEARERIALRTMEFGEYYFPGQSDPMHSPEGNANDTIGLFYASAILSDVLGNMEDNTEYIENAHFFRASYFLEKLRFLESMDLRMSVRSYEMVLHLKDLLSSNGEYSELLEMILSSLERRGQTLDLITGEIIPIETPEQGDVDIMVNYEEGLMQQANQGFVELGHMFADGLLFVGSIAPSLVACSTLVDKFINLPPFSNLIAVAISLGAFGFLLNLGISAVKSKNNIDSQSKPKGGKSK